MNSFVAIDVETAKGNRNSMCAIGIVAVKEHKIIEKRWILIQPPGNEYNSWNVKIHGIIPEMTVNAPTFPEIYPELKSYLNNNSIVCHNASFDLDVISQTMQHYNIEDELNIDCNCTLSIFGASLEQCCQKYGIALNHHDPLSDAEACARLFLIHNNSEEPCSTQEELTIMKRGNVPRDKRNNIRAEYLKPNMITLNKNTPFFGKKVVISGTYENWPDRNDLAKIIRDLGGDIDSSVTIRTNILCAGNNIGPAKYQKMMKNIEEGKDATILSENEIIEILKEAKIL